MRASDEPMTCDGCAWYDPDGACFGGTCLWDGDGVTEDTPACDDAVPRWTDGDGA